MKTICVFGDSVAKGVILDSVRSRYSFAKETAVSLISRYLNYPIKNFAKFGCTVGLGKKIFKSHSDAVAGADYTVFEFGGNDCDFEWEKIAENPNAEHLPKTSLREFGTVYTEMIDITREMGSMPILLTLPPLHAPRYFAWLSRGLNADNIFKWLDCDVHTIYRWHEMYNMQICNIAVKKSVPLFDIRSGFLQYGNYGPLLCEDGIHPNEDGQMLISNIIKKELPEILERSVINVK